MEKRELFDADGVSRGYYSETNAVNDLTGREWVFWTRSVITKAYPPNLQHRLRGEHGGQKPPDLCADLIRIFTKEGASVLDPFMGVGGVLLGASRSGRKALGVDINPRWIGIYREVCVREGIPEQETMTSDAAAALGNLADRRFDLVLTDVPYWRMDTARRSTGRYKKTGEASRPAPASRLSRFSEEGYGSKEQWLASLGEVFRLAEGLLRDRGYMAVFIGDMYMENEYHCLSADLAGMLRAIPGLVWKANLVWYDVSKKLHLYGYQYSYIPSMIHQNVVVFRKEGGVNFKRAAVDGKEEDPLRPGPEFRSIDRKDAAP